MVRSRKPVDGLWTYEEERKKISRGKFNLKFLFLIQIPNKYIKFREKSLLEVF
jgi:hypothetical protein